MEKPESFTPTPHDPESGIDPLEAIRAELTDTLDQTHDFINSQLDHFGSKIDHTSQTLDDMTATAMHTTDEIAQATGDYAQNIIDSSGLDATKKDTLTAWFNSQGLKIVSTMGDDRVAASAEESTAKTAAWLDHTHAILEAKLRIMEKDLNEKALKVHSDQVMRHRAERGRKDIAQTAEKSDTALDSLLAKQVAEHQKRLGDQPEKLASALDQLKLELLHKIDNLQNNRIYRSAAEESRARYAEHLAKPVDVMTKLRTQIAIMGLRRSGNQTDKQIYRTLARRYHPDTTGDPEGEDITKVLSGLYDPKTHTFRL